MNAAAIHTEERFEDEVCETLKANGWLFDGPLPYKKGYAYDAGYDKRFALYPDDAIAWVKETQCYVRRYSGLADAGCPEDFSSRLEIEA